MPHERSVWDTSCITDADVYPAEVYRKLRSTKQTSRISWSIHANNCTPIKLAPDRDVCQALVHIYTQRSRCFQFFLVFFYRGVILSWRFFEQSESDRLCGKIMTLGVFLKTNFHFYRMPRTDLLPTMGHSGPLCSRPTKHPLLPSQAVFFRALTGL